VSPVPAPPDDTLWDYEQVASYLQLSERWVQQKVVERSIPFVRLGTRTRFVPDEIRLWVVQQQTRAVG
jgi:excisionase family DNA binding protein